MINKYGSCKADLRGAKVYALFADRALKRLHVVAEPLGQALFVEDMPTVF